MDNDRIKRIRVKIKNQDMEAFLFVPAPLDEKDYTLPELEEALQKNGVIYGVNEAVVKSIVERKRYDEDILVARGVEAIEGKDGYYEFVFNRKPDKKPKIKPDGSVDFWSISMVEMVEKDQVIANYYAMIKGTDGMSVKGREVKAKLVRDLPPLKGKGFERSEDNSTYRSLMDGKIEMMNDRIIILPIYEISGDADISIGHIEFNGDVIVHGSVRAGVNIKATGTVSIDGIVEAATIEAGKDIVLRGGVMGGSKSVVKTKGSIFAKFFEYTRIEADGDIQADIFMNCEVVCKGKVTLSGKKGSIVGGNTWAVQGIEVENLGNEVEVKTSVRVGNDMDVMRRIKVLQKKVFTAEENLSKIEKVLKDFEKLERGVTNRSDPRKAQLLRIKIKDSAALSQDKNELDRLEQQVELSKEASIRANRYVFPGVIVGIDEVRVFVKDKQWEIEFVKNIDKIRMLKPILDKG